MKKLFTLLILLFSAFILKAQVRGLGNVDTADLRMTTCVLEKDANAMVLFDRAKVYFSVYGTMSLERHRRIKILNEKGKEQGNISIEYNNVYGAEHILNLEAQTINLENGKIVITRIDPKLIYDKHTDLNKDAIVFSLPNVKAGSVIEYRYTLARSISTNFPAWYFQSDIPTVYSEFDVYFNSNLKFKALTRTNIAFLRDTTLPGGHVWAAENIPSSKEEAFMRSPSDGLMSVSLSLNEVDFGGKTINLYDSWAATGRKLADEKDYYKHLDEHLPDEDDLIKKAALLKTDDDKIVFLYNEVKAHIGWNGYRNWTSHEGIKSAWKKRTGNSGEVNAVLWHLLKKSGIKAYPMLVSSRQNGLLDPAFVNLFQLNDLVTYIPVDSTKFYLLDATNRYYTYNEIPYDYLNSYGLCINKEKDKYDMVFIQTKHPSIELVSIEGEIGADAKMKGEANILSYGYNRNEKLEAFKTAGEEKFKEFLTERDNNIKIKDLKLENTEIDTLPLKQNFSFTFDLNNSDNYILFSPNIFTSLYTNPFLSEVRNAPVDFGFINNHKIFCRYKIPAGYKVESLPKNASIVMADKSIKFLRALDVEDGTIVLHYDISLQRTIFSKEDYPDLRAFYKKMYDLLNEQIILKKG